MPKNRDYKAEYRRAKELRDPEKHKDYARRWMQEWKNKNPEKYRARVRETQPKRNEAAKKYRASAKGQRTLRERYYQRNYGISASAYDRMFTEQNGLCFICRRPEKRRGRAGEMSPLEVDHNHETGQIRKLLCHACNVAIGFLEESPDRMRRLAEYIEEHSRVLERESENA